MSGGRKKNSHFNLGSINYYSGCHELGDYIIDEAVPEDRIIKKCMFPGCKTILNQYNVKRSAFCFHHQRVVNLFISEGKDSYVYEFFQAMSKDIKQGGEVDEKSDG